MTTEHSVEIFVNGWSINQLQHAVDIIQQRRGKSVSKMMCSHARRREFIHLLDLERKLVGYGSSLADCDVVIQAVREFDSDRAALVTQTDEPVFWFNFKTGIVEQPEGTLVS